MLDDLLLAAAQPALVVGPNGVIGCANQGAVIALGYDDADELIGRHLSETIDRASPDGLDRLVRRDGSMFPVSSVSVPLDMPDGRGSVLAFTDIEAQLRSERMLRERAAALAEEQAALRRVAALAAGGAPSADVFAAVAAEVAAVMHLPMVMVGRYDDDGAMVTIIGAQGDRPHLFVVGTRWPLDGPSLVARVLQTGRVARVEDYTPIQGSVGKAARHAGLQAAVAAPVVVDGHVWGVVCAGTADERAPVPADAESRISQFTALVATAISNSQAREDLHRLADEQAALRRVATLVAEDATPADVFAAVAREVALFLTLPFVAMWRYEPDGTATVVSTVGDDDVFPCGTNWPLDGPSLASVVRETGRPATVPDYAEVPGTIGERASSAGFTSGVGAPIVVDSHMWGAVAACSDQRRPLAPDAERRLSQFTALVATAISNSQAREDVRRLAYEQASLRRVATLVAESATPVEVLASVTQEIGLVLKQPLVAMFRYESDGTATPVGAIGDHPFQPGTNWPLDGPSMTGVVRRTGRPTRVEDYAAVPGTIGVASCRAGFKSGVAAPIVVDGEVWGVVCVGTADVRVQVPSDAESRLSQFTALVATAISNTQAREDLHRLATEQAALRRLATLVAQGAAPRVVFVAVCEETGAVFGATSIRLEHFTPDGFNLTMAGWAVGDVHVPAGTRLALDGDDVSSRVKDTAAPVRLESGAEAGAPVVVEGRVWGTLIAASEGPDPFPAGTEHRLASFAELIATAVSNAAARAELVDSRVRIVEAADEQRRRVVRDLHDGAQSRLIHTVIALERAKAHVAVAPDARPLVEEGLTHARSAIEELRELAHGIHPATLTNRGLAAAIEVLADGTPLAVQIEIADERYSTHIESALYFVAAEALTNVAKYARASTARISLTRLTAGLRLVIEDDGVGGAQRAPGGGLAGLADRLAALDGLLTIDSPPGGGTRIQAEIPLPAST